MKYIVKLMLFFGIILLLNNCEGKNDGGNVQDVISPYKADVTLTNGSDVNVSIVGKGEDALVLNIPSLAPDINGTAIGVQLVYNDDFPEIIIDKDINFSTPVELVFSSNNLIDGETTLVYKAPQGTYFVPSTVVNHTLRAKLWHFSSYGFDTVPKQSEQLKEDINSRLTALGESSQNKRFGEISQDNLGDLYVKMLAYEGSDAFDGMLHSFIDAVLNASNNTLNYYKNKNINYFNGVCPTDEMMDAMLELSGVYLYNKDIIYDNFKDKLAEEDYILVQGMYEGAFAEAEKILKDSKVKWETLNRPKCDNTVYDYVKCTQKYIQDVEFAEIIYLDDKLYSGNLAEDIRKELQDNIKNDAQEAINSGDCKCMLLYKDVINVYFKDTLSSTLQALEDATKSCNNSECPLLWDISYQAIGVYESSPDISWSGGVNFSDVYIEQVDDAWVKLSQAQRTACEPYRENYKGAEIEGNSYFGDLTPDDQITMQWQYIRVDDNNREYIGSPVCLGGGAGSCVNADIYKQLNTFETFSIEESTQGTVRFTFTPHVYGFKYSQ